jgi:hypothetical protein
MSYSSRMRDKEAAEALSGGLLEVACRVPSPAWWLSPLRDRGAYPADVVSLWLACIEAGSAEVCWATPFCNFVAGFDHTEAVNLLLLYTW